MALKPQDLLVTLKLWVGRGRAWSYQALAHELGMSVAESHNAVQRARKAGLLPSDLLRMGRARERQLAAHFLEERLK